MIHFDLQEEYLINRYVVRYGGYHGIGTEYKTGSFRFELSNFYEYTLTNINGIMVKVINDGGTITAIINPDKNDEMASVVLGFDSLAEFTRGKVLKNQSGKLAKAATAFEPKSGRIMEVYTTEPGIVFYTGNHLNERTIGRGGISFTKFGAFCLETQHYPDSPNILHFPNCILRPGDTFESQTIYKFSIKKE